MKSIVLLVLILASNWSYSQNNSTMTTEYLTIKDALVTGKQSEAGFAAEKLLSTLNRESTNFNLATKKVWDEKKKMLAKEIEIISKSNDIEKQRAAFANLSPTYWEILKASGSPEKLFYNYCPMKKGYWISAEEKISNPFYGSQMLTCGKVVEKIN